MQKARPVLPSRPRRYNRERWRLVCLMAEAISGYRKGRFKRWVFNAENLILAARKTISTLQYRIRLLKRDALPAAIADANNKARYSISTLRTYTTMAESQIPEISTLPITLREMALELNALQKKYPSLQYNAKEGWLSVDTDKITLEGICLGRFRIRLDLVALNEGEEYFYRVIALDPNPSARNRNVTHPHVLGEVMCEGESSLELSNALCNGTYLEWFDSVDRILHKYNEDSPHVKMKEWEGNQYCCTNCDYGVEDEEDLIECIDCQQRFCSNCITECYNCHEVLCCSCAIECECCHRSICEECAVTCSDCGQRFCQRHMDDDNRCPDCRDAHDAEQERLEAEEEERRLAAEEERAERERDDGLSADPEPVVTEPLRNVYGFTRYLDRPEDQMETPNREQTQEAESAQGDSRGITAAQQ